MSLCAPLGGGPLRTTSEQSMFSALPLAIRYVAPDPPVAIRRVVRRRSALRRGPSRPSDTADRTPLPSPVLRPARLSDRTCQLHRQMLSSTPLAVRLIRDSFPLSKPPLDASKGNFSANAKCENAPCNSVTDLTGDGSAAGSPASE